MSDSLEFLAGAINSDGEVALMLDRPLKRRPLFAILSACEILEVGDDRFTIDQAVAHALTKTRKALVVIMDGGAASQEFEIAVRQA